MKTVGELREALENFEDETELVFLDVRNEHEHELTLTGCPGGKAVLIILKEAH